MKKVMVLVVIIALVALAGVSFAAEQKKVAEPVKAQAPQAQVMQRPEMQQQMGMPMGMRMMPMPPMRTQVRQMVASDDGGVIVTTGDKIIKYDKNLNIVKEVTIPQEPAMMGGMQMQPTEQPKEQKK
jgi:hypothetical protein